MKKRTVGKLIRQIQIRDRKNTWHNTIRNRLRKCGGFSLTELLVATLIMLLATVLVTRTLSMAVRQLYIQTQESEAQLLCSSLSTYLESELSFATVTLNGQSEGEDAGGAVGVASGGIKSVSSDAHNMGEGICFGYIYAKDEADSNAGDAGQSVSSDATGSKGKLWNGTGSDSPQKGRMIGETSSYYSSYSEKSGSDDNYYNIAGEGSYILGMSKYRSGSYMPLTDRYGLNAALDCDSDMGWDGSKFNIRIVIYGNQDDRTEPLTDNVISVAPANIVKE